MKSNIFFATCMLSALLMAACQNSANSSNTTASNAGAGTNANINRANTSGSTTPAAAEPKKEMAIEDLSGIDTTKPVSADELNAQFAAKPDEWKGKKVAVSGLYKSYATSDGVNAASAYRTDLKDKSTKTSVGCFSKERPAIWGDFSKNYEKYVKEKVVVRGVVAGAVDYGDGSFVGLEPCEIVTK